MSAQLQQLTPEQEARFQEFVDKWTAIGRSTEPADRPRAERAIVALYTAKQLAPPQIIWTDSPRASGLARQAMAKAEAQASPGTRVQLYDVASSAGASGYGQHDAAWLAFYDFFREACGLVTQTEPLVPLFELAQSANWWLPHEHVCWVSERPSVLHHLDGQLHCDGGPALQYRDGFAIWALRGVRVPQWLAETSEEALDPRRMLQLDNAEVRQAFVRKVGIERICHTLQAQVVDRQDSYELLLLSLGDGRRRPYLKMQNPSVPEVWHVEGVPPEITTVQAALNWRNQLTDDQIDAEHGADWYQQGDVILKPQGATKLKPQPLRLT